MDISKYSTKDIGNLGERVVVEYLRRNGFRIIDQNVARKTGEIDIIAMKEDVLHFVEVKALVRNEFPDLEKSNDDYDPSDNLHPQKIQKVARTAEWYVAEKDWEGEWQVDGALVWLRARDGHGKVTFLPQIV